MYRMVDRRAGVRLTWLKMSDRATKVTERPREAPDLHTEIFRLSANTVVTVECTFFALLEHKFHKSRKASR
jgi:hypothetical protein